jgi:hypothetical protein
MSISIFPNYFHETHCVHQNVLRHFDPQNEISCPYPGAFRSAVNFNTGRLRKDFSAVRAVIAFAAILQLGSGDERAGYEGGYLWFCEDI